MPANAFKNHSWRESQINIPVPQFSSILVSWSKRRNDHIFDIDVEIGCYKIICNPAEYILQANWNSVTEYDNKNKLRKFPQLFWHASNKYSTTQTEYVKLYSRVLSFHRRFLLIISSRTDAIKAKCLFLCYLAYIIKPLFPV